MQDFNKQLIVKVPESLDEVVREAARRNYKTRSEYIRTAIIAQLERDGLCAVPMRAA
jgi:metal-responsive CopG/Arc/MetJ family transcriptional regulator